MDFKIIAVDFDGTLCENKWPEIGEANEELIWYLRQQQAAGNKIILWTCRVGELLQKAVHFCYDYGLIFDAVNENLPETLEWMGGDSRKIFAHEYIDDRNAWYPMGDVSDGYHTFNSLYHQRCILFAALCNTFSTLAWKSRKHSDGKECFDGGYFIVGIDTPKGNYTYHYKNEHWDKFKCRELEVAPEWDGHTDKDVERLLSLNEEDESNMSSWAKREIEIACERERAAGVEEAVWDYGCACYESAYRAFQSLCRDGHSGCSIGFTKQILNRLIDGKPLVPIKDTEDVWNHVSGFDSSDKETGYSQYQCKRMSSLFKTVYSDGTVKYSDIDSHYCVNINNPDVTYHSGLVRGVIDELFPITIPYCPPNRPIKVYCEDFLVDPKNGDFDTVGILYAIKPDGEKIDINRFFKEADDGFTEIDIIEYKERKGIYEAPRQF